MCAICISETVREGIVVDMPRETLASFEERSTQISMAELIAVFLLFIFYAERFSDCDAAVFIDNIGVIFNIVNGSTKSRDSAAIVLAIHSILTANRITPWFEHVPTWTNIADGGFTRRHR